MYSTVTIVPTDPLTQLLHAKSSHPSVSLSYFLCPPSVSLSLPSPSLPTSPRPCYWWESSSLDLSSPSPPAFGDRKGYLQTHHKYIKSMTNITDMNTFTHPGSISVYAPINLLSLPFIAHAPSQRFVCFLHNILKVSSSDSVLQRRGLKGKSPSKATQLLSGGPWIRTQVHLNWRLYSPAFKIIVEILYHEGQLIDVISTIVTESWNRWRFVIVILKLHLGQ